MSSKSQSSAPAHPSTDKHNTVEAQYASLERPHACTDGWVTMASSWSTPRRARRREELRSTSAAAARSEART